MMNFPGVQAQGGGFTLRIAGQPSNQIVEALDGVPSDGPVNLVQNMNDFEELQVVGANNSAEFSRVTNFSMSGKSGSNAFHGSAFYDFTSSALASRAFFDAKKPASHQHRSGLNVSGPIKKNRTFFMLPSTTRASPEARFTTARFHRWRFGRAISRNCSLQLIRCQSRTLSLARRFPVT